MTNDPFWLLALYMRAVQVKPKPEPPSLPWPIHLSLLNYVVVFVASKRKRERGRWRQTIVALQRHFSLLLHGQGPTNICRFFIDGMLNRLYGFSVLRRVLSIESPLWVRFGISFPPVTDAWPQQPAHLRVQLDTALGTTKLTFKCSSGRVEKEGRSPRLPLPLRGIV